jgi:hypothetical protein
VGGHNTVYQQVLQISHRLELLPQELVQFPEGGFVFSGEKDLPLEQTVLRGVVADGGLPIRCLGPGAL